MCAWTSAARRAATTSRRRRRSTRTPTDATPSASWQNTLRYGVYITSAGGCHQAEKGTSTTSTWLCHSNEWLGEVLFKCSDTLYRLEQVKLTSTFISRNWLLPHFLYYDKRAGNSKFREIRQASGSQARPVLNGAADQIPGDRKWPSEKACLGASFR